MAARPALKRQMRDQVRPAERGRRRRKRATSWSAPLATKGRESAATMPVSVGVADGAGPVVPPGAFAVCVAERLADPSGSAALHAHFARGCCAVVTPPPPALRTTRVFAVH